MKSDLYNQVEYIQNALIAYATNDEYDVKNYEGIRNLLINNSSIAKYLPDFVHSSRTLKQFWLFIKRKFSTYAERREFIWDSFNILLSKLEKEMDNPLDIVISITISENADIYIKEQWEKALERRNTDPEGAITTARTLVETTCKYILDVLEIEYEDNIELPKLYNLTAKQLNLAPQNHQEEIFKQILGGCQSVINGLGSLRNKVGDAHGKGLRYVKPHERHAKLAVNLAGTLSSFLIDTFNQKKEKTEIS
jgi:hypothetical protein